MAFISYQACPVCGGSLITARLTVKDFTVSKNKFTILECAQCTLRFTQDVPDANSIADYYRSEDYISHTDTKKGLINRLYHIVRNRTIAAKMRFIRKSTSLQVGKLLDIGAGTGAFLDFAKKSGWDVTGLEPDLTARDKAKELYQLDLLDAEALHKLTPSYYDAITLWHVLEHVHDLHAYIEQLKNLLSPNGRIFIAVPNYTSHDADHYKEYWAAYDVPRHLYHFSPLSIEVLIEQHGLQVKQMQPMWYDSFYISMLSEQYKNGKPANVKAAWVGLQSNWNSIWDRETCSSLIYVIAKVNTGR